MITDEVLQTVRAARLDGQDLRRKARTEVKPEERDRLFREAEARFEGAITALKRALRSLRREQSEYSPDVCLMLESLSQTLGSLGGTHRDAGNLVRAIARYDEGNEIEKERRQSCGARDSYNLLQRLVVRLLYPAVEDEATASALLKKPSFAKELFDARQEIEDQVDAGRTDSWALADLALVRFLCGDDAGPAIEDLDRRKSEGSFYESAYAVTTALIKEGLGAGEPLGARLEELQRFLKRKGGLA
jgi:hypothetical protein